MMMNSFERHKNNSIYWFNKASDLHGAAAALWAAMNSATEDVQTELGLRRGFRFDVALPLPYRMVCGMSLELLLKALIVEAGQEPRKDHNLPRLATDAGVTFDAKQIALLRILSEAII